MSEEVYEYIVLLDTDISCIEFRDASDESNKVR